MAGFCPGLRRYGAMVGLGGTAGLSCRHHPFLDMACSCARSGTGSIPAGGLAAPLHGRNRLRWRGHGTGRRLSRQPSSHGAQVPGLHCADGLGRIGTFAALRTALLLYLCHLRHDATGDLSVRQRRWSRAVDCNHHGALPAGPDPGDTAGSASPAQPDLTRPGLRGSCQSSCGHARGKRSLAPLAGERSGSNGLCPGRLRPE